MASKVGSSKIEEGQRKDSSSHGSSSDSSSDSLPKPKPLTKWEKIGYSVFGLTFIGGLIANAILFSLPDWDVDGNTLVDEYSHLPFYSQYYQRLKAKIFTTKKTLEEPFSDTLLPEPLKEPYYQPKYTILLELTGLLVHATWTHKHGWRFQKRPGVDMFLSQVGYPNFEVVIYTTENAMTFYPIIDGLDPNNQFIMHRLFRDATRYVNGCHTKDIQSINRDPKKVIVVDWNADSVQLQSENSLILQKWEGDNTDRQMIGLAQMLQAIKQTNVDDVRDVLRHYRQFDDPISAFRENQRKLQEEISVNQSKKQEAKSSNFVGGLTSSSLLSWRNRQ